MTDLTWDISFQLTGTYENASLVQTFNVPATVTGTIVTTIDSGFLNVESDFISWSFTYSAPSVGFAGSASGGPTIIALFGNVLSASGDTLSYIFDPNIVFANHIFFNDATDFFEQVDFGISLAGHDFVQGDIQLRDGLVKSDLFDATVTQPFQIGTEVVATLADVTEVGTSEINIDLSSIFNVAGDVTISDNDQLVSIDLSHLLSVGGNFTLTGNGALLTISLPSLTTVTGNIDVAGDASLGAASFGSLSTVTGNVNVTDDASLTTLDLGSLSTVTGGIDVSGDASLGTASLGSLSTVTGNVNVTDDASLATLDMGNLSTVTGSVNVSEDAALEIVNLGSLTTVTGDIDVSGDATLGTAILGSLTTVTGNVNVTDDASLTALGMGNLSTVTGSVNFSDNASLVTIDLSALLQAGAIVISDNGVVTLDLSALVTAGGDVSITDNTHLLTVDLPNLTTVDGNLDISGDTSATTVDLGSLSTATGDVTITSGADATLDASAFGPGGGTVALIGDNLTTTITLGSLDHLGGTLTISSADGVTLTAHAGLADLAITGTDADNILIGSATANNTVDGRLGDDLMTGGRGDDTFVFDFSVSQQTQFHHDFVSLADVTSVTLGDITYSRPAVTASITAWSNWNTELTGWANSRPDNTGGDDFSSFTNANPGGKHTGTIQLIDGYFHDHNTTVTNVAGEGFDTVTNFANQALTVANGGGGNDVLLFTGLSNDPTAANYWVNVLSSTTANGNTTIHVHDVADGGADVSSITLLGVTTDVASLVQKAAIQFDSGFHLT